MENNDVLILLKDMTNDRIVKQRLKIGIFNHCFQSLQIDFAVEEKELLSMNEIFLENCVKNLTFLIGRSLPYYSKLH